ncbi:MAG: 50S ribosomal protein L23 [Verrucomicrobia bacterium]|nr:50S ribosomal protein L23 [Verrucomicrobiota bacterium]
MAEPIRILKKHLVTEKATEAASNLNQYYFSVATDANRIAVKQAVEKQFGVEVVSVNIANVKPKAKSNRMRRGVTGKKSGYKRAIVRLKAGQSIALA